MHRIPVIDISGLAGADGGRRGEVAAAVGRACREVGFFAISGHGLPAAKTAGIFAAAHQLFAQPPVAKEALAIQKIGGNRGYVGLEVEQHDTTKPADLKEAFNLCVSYPAEALDPARLDAASGWPDLPGWRAAVTAYFDAAWELGRLVHRAFAIDLGLPETFFDDKIGLEPTLRLLRYPPIPGDPATGQLGSGVHTDYGTLTILATDGVPGLQAQALDGTWIDAPDMGGAFICNICDCLMRWTNDVYRSTPHRVAMRAGDRDRYSVPFFMGAKAETIVTPLASCIAPGARPLYPPISAGDYLQQRLNETYPHLQKAG